ncbi:BRCA2 and CDKN1A-interacting protein, partial [Galemys pyrenaicus]
EVNVDFEAYAISAHDHDGIRKLLQQLFLKAPVNTAELTDLLIQQNHIGSVIKVSGGRLPRLISSRPAASLLPFSAWVRARGTPCAEQIKDLVLSGCEKSCGQSAAERLDELLNDASRPVGFLLSERFINVPPQVALPMHQQLQKELAEAQKTNKPCGKCCFYLLISKTFAEAGRNAKKKSSSQDREELMFANAEEEFFYEKAALRFSYSVQEESDSRLGGRWSFDDVPMKPLRTVMLVPVDRMDAVMEKLRDHLSI